MIQSAGPDTKLGDLNINNGLYVQLKPPVPQLTTKLINNNNNNFNLMNNNMNLMNQSPNQNIMNINLLQPNQTPNHIEIEDVSRSTTGYQNAVFGIKVVAGQQGADQNQSIKGNNPGLTANPQQSQGEKTVEIRGAAGSKYASIGPTTIKIKGNENLKTALKSIIEACQIPNEATIVYDGQDLRKTAEKKGETLAKNFFRHYNYIFICNQEVAKQLASQNDNNIQNFSQNSSVNSNNGGVSGGTNNKNGFNNVINQNQNTNGNHNANSGGISVNNGYNNTNGGFHGYPSGVNANTITLKCVNNNPNGMRNNDISFDDIVIGKEKTIGELKKRILMTKNNGQNNLLRTLSKTENDFVICKVDQEGNPEMILEDKNMPLSLAFHGDSSYVIVPRYIHCEIIVNDSPRIFKYPVVVKNAQKQDDFNKTTLKAFIESELEKQGEAIESYTFEYWINYKNVKLANGWDHAGFKEIKGGSITIKNLPGVNANHPGVNANFPGVIPNLASTPRVNNTNGGPNHIQNEGYIQNNDGDQIQNNNIKKPNDILTSGYNNLQNNSMPQPIIIPVKKEGPTVIPVYDEPPTVNNTHSINNQIRFPYQPPQLNLNKQTAIQTKNELESLTIKRNVNKMLADLLEDIENGNFGGPESPSSAIKSQIQSNNGYGTKVQPIYDEIEETKSNQNNPSNIQAQCNPNNQLANQQMSNDKFNQVDRNVKKMLADLFKDIANGNFGGPKLQIQSQMQPKPANFKILGYPTLINNQIRLPYPQAQYNPNNLLANQQMTDDKFNQVDQNVKRAYADIFNLFKIYSNQIKKPINKKIKKKYTKKIYTIDNGI